MLEVQQIDDILYYNYDNNNYNVSILNDMDKAYNHLDVFQYIINGFILNNYFPWMLLILILNKGRLKRPVIFILIAHWFLKGTGIAVKNSIYFNPQEEGKYWPNKNTKNRYILSISQTLYICGEIVGDWYPLLRTKAVTENRNALKKIYISCITFNLTKILLILRYYVPFPMNFNHTESNNQNVTNQRYINSILIYYCLYTVMIVASFVYDLTVILTLRKKVFIGNQDINKSSDTTDTTEKSGFLDKFKRLSEYRIFITMAGSLIILSFLILLLVVRKEKCITENHECQHEPLDYIISSLSFLIRDINYNIMYIDQILLKFYAERCNPRFSMESDTTYRINISRHSTFDEFKKRMSKDENNRDSSTTLISPYINKSIHHELSINKSVDATLNNSYESIDITQYQYQV